MRYKLIQTPEGSGSSTKDFNVKDDLFYVTRGTYGGKKVTLVKFQNSNLEFCFEGIIDFADADDVMKEIIDHDIKNISVIFQLLKDTAYEYGFNDGVQSIKRAFKSLLN